MRTSLCMFFLGIMLMGTGTSYAQFTLNCTDSVRAINAFASEGNGMEAYDGNPGTRWGTGATDPQWVAYELDTIYNINQMVIRWEAANAKDYRVEGTNDTAQGWVTMASLKNRATTLGVGNGDRYDTISNLVGAYKFIRVYGTSRTTPYGYSIWEIRFCGAKNRAVSGNSAPVASASSDVNSGMAPLTVNFNGSSSTDPDSDPLSYSWSFGDGGHSSMANPSHVYSDPGNYTAILTVSDGNNGFDTSVVQINAMAVVNNPAVNCGQPAVLSAYASSGVASLAADGSMATRWESQFSDPQWIVFKLDSVYTLNTMVIHWETASAADYTIEGTNDTSSAGSWTTLASKVNLPATPNRVDSVFNLSGNYQFVRVHGTARATPYGYSIFEVTLCGTGFSAGQRNNVDPVASFTAMPVLGNAPLLVNFDASGSTDADGDTLTYSWNFGDGNMGSDTTATHTYVNAGVYYAKLTVDDGYGGTDIDSVKITVNPPFVNNDPVLSFTVTPLNGRVPLKVFADASATTDVDGDSLAFNWDFGNGTFSTDTIDSVTYVNTGQYYVKLTVDDGNGGVIRDSVQVSVNPNAAPIASFTASPLSGTAPLTVDFNASASSDSDGDTLTYAWAFGDGNFDTDTTASHTYSTPGIYTVVLTVDDGHGDTAKDSVQVQVYPNNPVANCGTVGILNSWASEEPAGFAAALAHDGNPASRWGTGASDPQWIAFELNATYNLNGIIINWEAANAKDYEIQASNDTATGWVTLASRVNMPTTLGMTPSNRIDTVNGLSGAYKYVRIYGTARTTPFGYSIFEVSLCGTNSNTAPVISLLANPVSGTAPLKVTFDATGTVDAENDPLSYSWDFDNGRTASGDSLDLTFFNAGVYNVKLTVSDGQGNSVMDSVTITVNASAPVSVSNCSVAYIDSAWATSGNASLAVDNNAGTRWESVFSDPQTITFRMDNQYILNGLIINWETASAASYFVEATNDTNVGWTTVAYRYNMAATANRIDTIAPITGTYQFLRIRGLSRTTAFGYSIFEVEVCGTRVNTAPVLSFTASPVSGLAPLLVNFDASASTDADGDVLTYSWDFGDGNNGSGASTTHTYTTKGDFYAKVTADDGFGGVVTDSVLISVTGYVGLGEISQAGLQVYPNPAGEKLFIHSSGEPVSSVRVFDLGGRLMMESGNPAKMNEMELDLKSLGCGVYILQTVKGTEVRTIRFIKS
ncbi:MAG TPA: hypothetical protein DDW81_03485 [Cryomorphaceae bacterium]|nr:hypothetical protein [Owenweeksia sp.]HBF19132.1 hypothetical protein [Cryomorphaceae bacterium]